MLGRYNTRQTETLRAIARRLSNHKCTVLVLHRWNENNESNDLFNAGDKRIVVNL
jgi:hypothetical protein